MFSRTHNIIGVQILTNEDLVFIIIIIIIIIHLCICRDFLCFTTCLLHVFMYCVCFYNPVYFGIFPRFYIYLYHFVVYFKSIYYSLFHPVVKIISALYQILSQFTFTFTFSHLADAFIQSDLQLGVHKAINLEEANIQRKCQ